MNIEEKLGNLEFKLEDLIEKVDRLERLVNPPKVKFRTCPKCGGDLNVDTLMVLACYPPKYRINCKNSACTYIDTIDKDQIPFIECRDGVHQ